MNPIIPNKVSRVCYALLISAFSIGNMMAMPAKPGLHNVTQPDGTSLTVKLQGDFHSRLYLSEDGYPLLPDNEGYYNFATLDAEGNAVDSGIKAVNLDQRNNYIINSLSSINKESVIKALVRSDDVNIEIPTRGPGLFSTTFPSKGEQRSLAVIVEFQDKKFTLEDPHDYFYRLLNEEGFSDFNATGSAKDYFVKNSSGIFQPSFDLYGPLTLENDAQYYGSNNDAKAYMMAVEACRQLDDEVDFSIYDANGDGLIDNIYIFYAGYGEADGGGSLTIWPHSWDLSAADPRNIYRFDGVILEHYACSNELQHDDNEPDGIGSFCHEFSHVLGLPDLYNTGGSGSPFTPGYWSVLDVGSYSNDGRTPPNYSAYERYALDWTEPIVLEEEGDYSLENLEDSNTVFIMHTDKGNEFYLLENRQQKGYDTYLPWHGMLVWHIDYVKAAWDSNSVNTRASHQYVDLIEADNILTHNTLKGDPFPGTSNITEFSCQTAPALLSWNRRKLAVDIVDIKESIDGFITFSAVKCVEESGIDKINSDTSGNVIVSGHSVHTIEGIADLYDISGRHIATVGTQPTEISPGLYIVVSDTTKQKIFVR